MMAAVLMFAALAVLDAACPPLVLRSCTRYKISAMMLGLGLLVSVLMNLPGLHLLITQLSLLVILLVMARKAVPAQPVLKRWAAVHALTLVFMAVVLAGIVRVHLTPVLLMHMNAHTRMAWSVTYVFMLVCVADRTNLAAGGASKIVVVITGGLLLGLTLGILLAETSYGDVMPLSRLYMFLGASALWWLYVIVSFLNETLTARKEKETLEQEYRLNQVRLDHLMDREKYQEELRKFKHDIQNNLLTLEYLAEQDKRDEALDYLKNLSGRLAAIQPPERYAAHPVINAGLVNAVEKYPGVTFDIRCDVSAENKVDDVDLNAILSNLLDNAAEYVQNKQLTNAVVKVRIGEQGGFLVMGITNPVTEDFKGLESQKNDRRAHGLGLRIVRDAVAKYNGVTDFKTEDGCFRARILLKNIQ